MSGGELLGVLYEVLSHDVSVNWRSFPGLQPPRSDQWLPLGAFQMISNWTAILIGCQLCDFCCRHVRGHCHARHLLSGGGGGGIEDGEGGQRKSCVRCSFHGPHLLWISEVWLLGQTSMIIMLLCNSLLVAIVLLFVCILIILLYSHSCKLNHLKCFLPSISGAIQK